MLDPITRHMTDHSTESQFHFSFHCDLCGHAWDSVPMDCSAGKNGEAGAVAAKTGKESSLWQSEHEAAYERANREAMMHFNRCPACKRWVCDDCFLLLEDRDVCRECSEQSTKNSAEGEDDSERKR